MGSEASLVGHRSTGSVAFVEVRLARAVAFTTLIVVGCTSGSGDRGADGATPADAPDWRAEVVALTTPFEPLELDQVDGVARSFCAWLGPIVGMAEFDPSQAIGGVVAQFTNRSRSIEESLAAARVGDVIGPNACAEPYNGALFLLGVDSLERLLADQLSL